MTDQQHAQLRAAWRDATAALARLRAALDAAGIDPDQGSATIESAEARRRRLARERTQRWRTSQTVTPSVTVTLSIESR